MERQILRNGVPEKSAESDYEFNEWFGDGSTGTAVHPIRPRPTVGGINHADFGD